MKFTLVEQEKVMGDFGDPIDFIRAYIDVYAKQKSVPVKVYLSELPYYQKFESIFLDMVLKQSLSTDTAVLNFPEVELLVFDFHNKDFYDRQFYLESTLILIKGIAILIDRVDQEVQRYNFSNVGYLYYYTTEPIDLTWILVDLCSKDIKDPGLLVDRMSVLKSTVSLINDRLEDVGRSFLAHDKRLKDRMSLSEKILGTKRMERYDIENLYRCIFDLVIVTAGGMSTDDGYMYVMEFCSEYLTAELGKDESIAHLKEYSASLLGKRDG